MEVILLIAAVVVFALLRKHHARLKELEQQVSSLRAQIASGVVVSENAVQNSAADAAPGLLDGSVDADDATTEKLTASEAAEDFVASPWQRAAAKAAATETPLLDDVPAQQLPQADQPAARKRDFETALGTRWAVWVGGIALALGSVFLVRYSIEAGIFGPGVRLTAAALFGLALAAGGEFARRRGFNAPIGGLDSAYVPSILTAAAAFTLFAVTFAAHGVYGFIGPTPAFLILGALALGTIALSLLHGQALAGMGLLGSYLTPILVASDSPSPWTLFVYLSIVLAAAVAVASIRHWRFLAAAAYVGAGFWSFVYVIGAPEAIAAPVAFMHLVGFAVLAVVWLAKPAITRQKLTDPAAISAGLFGAIAATVLADPQVAVAGGYGWAAVLIVAMLAVAAWRRTALPLLHAGAVVTVLISAWGLLGGRYFIDLYGGRFVIEGEWVPPLSTAFQPYGIGLCVLFLAGGIAMALRTISSQRRRAAAWAFWAAAVPVWVAIMAWLSIGNLNIDWRFAAAGFALTIVLAVSGELLARAERPLLAGGRSVTFTLVGSAVALCFALTTAFGPLLTTILTGLAAALPALATRERSYPVLGWLSAGFAAVTLVRIGSDPTIVGAARLSTTPVFNQLLAGYLLPAVAFGFAAWQLARTTSGRPRLAMEAFAALFALMGAAMLVRHAMNGGVIDSGEPSLAEQAIYTLIMIGGGAILLSLDRRSPSPVFRIGSMALGVLSVLSIISAHFFVENPLLTNESTGRIPVFNLILLAYLLPAVAMAAVAWRARGVRPGWYVSMLAACAAALAFAYVTLSVRRVFQGEFIGAWKGMDGPETYTYTAVWLVLGVAILAAGIRFDSRVLRLGSAVLVVLAVAKAFLYDMSELEGVLRALSFMGLGLVLIGIGMFYQKMLMSTRKPSAE